MIDPATVLDPGYTIERWFDFQLLMRGTQLQSTSRPVFRIEYPEGCVTMDQTTIDRYYAAGWSYVGLHRQNVVFADRLPSAATSLELFWRLELEKFDAPTLRNSFTLHCAVRPEAENDLDVVRERVFVAMSRTDVWSKIKLEGVRQVGQHALYSYRIDLVR